MQKLVLATALFVAGSAAVSSSSGECRAAGSLPAAPEVAIEPSLEVYATGICRCVDGSCKQVSCSAEAGVSLEASKQQLRLELEAQAQSQNGTLDQASVRFTIRKKF